MLGQLQTALRLIYPPRCTICGAMVESDFGLCGPCWRDTPFISGLICDACGLPLPGDSDGTVEFCDDCLRWPRPWVQGRAPVLYQDNGRQIVLQLKHADRHEVVHPAGLWMTNAARDILRDDMVVAPVPLHWSRMLRRRFNQAALLARAVARNTGLDFCPDLLWRQRRTRSLEGLGREERHAVLADAIGVQKRHAPKVVGRSVLLVDDVMTSGATLSAATQACQAAGADHVCVLVLARVAKDDYIAPETDQG